MHLFNEKDLDDGGEKAGHSTNKSKKQGLEVNVCVLGEGCRRSPTASLKQRLCMSWRIGEII